jgi:hypothetical protein
MVTVSSVLYTESFILFLAGLSIFIIYINFFNTTYKKNDVKWNEIVLFYSIFKNWNKALRRDTHIRMAHFISLSLQMQKYELEWVKKNLNNIIQRDYYDLEKTTLRRLEILSIYNKQMKFQTKTNGLRTLPISE